MIMDDNDHEDTLLFLTEEESELWREHLTFSRFSPETADIFIPPRQAVRIADYAVLAFRARAGRLYIEEADAARKESEDEEDEAKKDEQ
jgi:hypothetical protein